MRFVAIGALLTSILLAVSAQNTSVTEAPAGFDGQTNGLVDQQTHDADADRFREQETISSGLGPVYNAQSCGECHQTPVTGAASQVSELRAGHFDAQGNFVPAPGGSLIHDRAIDASIQPYVPAGENVRTFRMSISTLGDGYVEAVSDDTLKELAAKQRQLTGGAIAGQFIEVPVMESPGSVAVGRFGWKDQHASLLSFAADAYLNEMGITNRLMPEENTSMGRSVAAFDTVADPEDVNNDIDAFARFSRAAKVPPPDSQLAGTADALAGSALFDKVGCGICHVRTLVTAPAGTALLGGTYVVPQTLASKIIHPYSDYLLHNVGTGDGIVQNGGPATAFKLRTAPLWGLRARDRHMHDGLSLTLGDAILRHRGEAERVIDAYRALSPRQRRQLDAFLGSL
ncbi:MAG: hypothetical protein JO187_06395 [Acidobacteria bacterium]|nr:hypothetical protein [Acidobacteriota bacterium]